MIFKISPFETQLRKIQEIPETFFNKIEESTNFDNSLFPNWLYDEHGNPQIFSQQTELRNKFEAIYNKYKAIEDNLERKKIIDAYVNTNRIVDLCNNNEEVLCYELNDLHESIRKEIDSAFLYLYKSALNHTEFLEFVKDSNTVALKKFTEDNKLELCPFCGLETMLQLVGQPRISLDHWLNKDRFPFGSVNFDNLIPIGTVCNSNGVKGSKNTLKDKTQLNRVKSYYPYQEHNGISINVISIEKPTIQNQSGKWQLCLEPNDNNEKEAFDSWDFIFNISSRYKDYFESNTLLRWQSDYVDFIKNDDDNEEFIPPETVTDLRNDLKIWRKTFQMRKKHGSVIYRPFLNFLINESPDEYLYGIVENWKSQKKKGLV
jgi:hypothetical protein